MYFPGFACTRRPDTETWLTHVLRDQTRRSATHVLIRSASAIYGQPDRLTPPSRNNLALKRTFRLLDDGFRNASFFLSVIFKYSAKRSHFGLRTTRLSDTQNTSLSRQIFGR